MEQRKITFKYKLLQHRGRFEEIRISKTIASTNSLYKSFISLGGVNGWKAWNFLWVIRKLIDRILGGKSIGEPDRDNLSEGSLFDCFIVEKIEVNKKLLLKMNLKTPGEAWLKFEAIEDTDCSYLVVSAIFEPKGIWGYLYWYSILPLHKFIFRDLTIAIKNEAEANMVV